MRIVTLASSHPLVGKAVIVREGVTLFGGLRGKVVAASGMTLAVELYEGRGGIRELDRVRLRDFEVEPLQLEMQL